MVAEGVDLLAAGIGCTSLRVATEGLTRFALVLEKLKGVAGEPIRQTEALSIESLRKQAGTRKDPDRTGRS
jgi:hypothetical protein